MAGGATIGHLLSSLRQRVGSTRSSGTGVGVQREPLTETALRADLDALGDAGPVAEALDRAVGETMQTLRALSDLSAPLALNYLERINRPISALTTATGVFLTVRGYAAHLTVEARGGEFGVTEVPVIDTFPPLHHGQAPRDLLTRVVRATRRGFPQLRALDQPTWDGFVAFTQWRAHGLDDGSEEGDAPGQYLDRSVVDGLVRFGWILRQADLFYGQQPDRS